MIYYPGGPMDPASCAICAWSGRHVFTSYAEAFNVPCEIEMPDPETEALFGMTPRAPQSVKILVGYECSGAVRRAFRRLGFDAWSCDLVPAWDESPYHLTGDVWDHVDGPWDFAIFHPPCTFLTNSASWAFNDPDFARYPGVGYHQRVKPGTKTGAARRAAREESLREVERLFRLPYPKVVENPRGFIGTMLEPPTQTIQPYEFGNDASKATCLWAKPGPDGRTPPRLRPTRYHPPRIVGGKKRWSNQTDSGQNKLGPRDGRASERSETYPGIASAMAAQYGGWLLGLELPDHHANALAEIEHLLGPDTRAHTDPETEALLA